MSKYNVYPVYTVMGHDGSPCGHQHQTNDSAENCAMNRARRFKGKVQTVIEWDQDGARSHCGRFEVPLKPVLVIKLSLSSTELQAQLRAAQVALRAL